MVRITIYRVATTIPCAVLIALASPNIFFQLPATHDPLTESYQPLKTLRFFQEKGAYAHKWGPVPNFVYAPFLAPPLAYWLFTGELVEPSGDYPYGLSRPHEQLGTLLVVIRLVILSGVLLALLVLFQSFCRISNNPIPASFGALMIAASPLIALAAIKTKPDGLMIAFLIGFMAFYAQAVVKGLNQRTGAWMAAMAVLSLSCKELTAPLFVIVFVGMFFHEMLKHGQRARLVRDWAVIVLVSVVVYLLVNVIYAPLTFVDRLRLVFGDLKDPAIWAPPNYTSIDYLTDTAAAVLQNLSVPGMAITLLAGVICIFLRPQYCLIVWLPLIGHVVSVFLLGGYMPAYFMLPVPVLAALPVFWSLNACEERLTGGQVRQIYSVTAFLFLAMIAVSAANGIATRDGNPYYLVERYAVSANLNGNTIYPVTTHRRNPGSSRLSYLGFDVEDRPLGDLISNLEDGPEVVFIEEDFENWLADFKQISARNEAWMSSTGFDYSSFDGFESVGYELEGVLKPQVASWLHYFYWPRSPPRGVKVYRKTTEDSTTD
jgi:hypothetical protein